MDHKKFASKGGKTRAKRMTAAQRSAAARKAALARWEEYAKQRRERILAAVEQKLTSRR